MLMADCIGGSAKTCMVVCCSPLAEDSNETINSLSFAKRCKGITNLNVGRNKAQPNDTPGRSSKGGGGGGGGPLKDVSPGVVSRAQQALKSSLAAEGVNVAAGKGQPSLTRKPSEADVHKITRWCEDELARLKEAHAHWKREGVL